MIIMLFPLMVAAAYLSYQTGKYVGVKQTFDYLEKEGQLIDKQWLINKRYKQ